MQLHLHGDAEVMEALNEALGDQIQTVSTTLELTERIK